MLSDGLIEGERAPGDVIAPAADDDAADVTVAQGASRATLTMSRVDPILPSALQDRMGCHETAAVEDADDVGKLMHLDDAAGPIGNAVVVAANRDEPVMADAPFELEECVEGCCRQRLEVGLLGREGLRHDPLRRAVQADVGDRVEPVGELAIEVIEITE